MKPNKLLALIVLIAVIVIACILRCPIVENTVIGQEKTPADKAFIEGFEAGVRYGLVAYISDPTEKDIPTITKNAKKWYYLLVVDEGKILMGKGKTEIKRGVRK